MDEPDIPGMPYSVQEHSGVLSLSTTTAAVDRLVRMVIRDENLASPVVDLLPGRLL